MDFHSYTEITVLKCDKYRQVISKFPNNNHTTKIYGFVYIFKDVG